VSNDGKAFDVSVDVAKQSTTIRYQSYIKLFSATVDPPDK
jgi:hypothetical protein